MADEDVYELHVCEGGRWSCVERFRSAEKDDAIAEANRQFASAGIEAVRVIREVYDQTEQVFKQRTVFRNAKPKADIPTFSAKSAPPPRRTPPPPAPRVAAAPAKPAPRPQSAVEDATRLGAIKRAEPAVLSHTFAVVKRLLIATAVGLLLSGIVFAVLSTPSGARLFDHVQERIVYGGIVALFVASFFLSLYLFSRAESRSRPARAVATSETAPVSGAETAVAVPENWADREIPIGAPADEMVPELPEGAAAPAEPVVDKEALADLQEKAKPAEKPVEKPPEPPVVEEFPAAGTADRETLLRFFRDGMMHANTQPFLSDGKMAPHNRFGCHLFLLGAGRACLAASRSDPASLGPVLQSALELLGTDAQRARSFIAKEDEYAKDAKYKGMIQVGAKAMDRFLSGHGPSAAAALGQALKAWNTSDAAAEPQGDNIAIMFTDMVSSVETTQALGDQGMMKLVQTHNLIVGSVLKTHRGHQVKHTGDGIMAVFPRVADGVAAAGEIQRQIAEHNRVTASSYLKVRMGLAVGQPIRDQDDYFGTVVQLAARLCACAGEAEICVANAIVEQVSGTKRFNFTDVREVKLKGFAEAQKMRFLLWEQRAAVPAA
ncbi:MAG TPA: adenylate/guanylate cyclase domain-containing protein [Candidatus Sulfotelmatobacter sp.]|nr:adenylate/guanylate cyclase domain-containing protein [Candidatus Sulfotelmatobacter sp.]